MVAHTIIFCENPIALQSSHVDTSQIIGSPVGFRVDEDLERFNLLSECITAFSDQLVRVLLLL